MAGFIVIAGARIVRFEGGVKQTYKGGRRVELNEAEQAKYQFIVRPAANSEPKKHEVRNAK